MWPGVKSCCGANGQYKNKKTQQSQTGRECKQIAFEHQKSLDLHIELPVVGLAQSDFPPRPPEPVIRWSGVSPIEPSPPDLQALHATFLI
jgi:hypothetical protein